MALNKNALIRYKTIDKCLQNNYREWTLDNLIEACSNALYEYEGREVNVSKRTLQLDIQMMRSDKLGYNSPIIVYNKKFYKYDDPDYSITDIPLNENDMNVLTETVEMLKQFKDFSLFADLGGIIQRLEDKVYAEKTKRSAIIHLDRNENLKGLEYIDILYQAILKKIVLQITYKPFRARNATKVPFHPYILKEYNNRWFLIGKISEGKPIINFALDRITCVDYDLSIPYLDVDFNSEEYYKNTIGVTVLTEKNIHEVLLKIDKSNAPYVLTKPLHYSQEIIENLKNGDILIKLKVHVNYELVRLILGFGESIEVIKPKILRKNIRSKLKKAILSYK